MCGRYTLYTTDDIEDRFNVEVRDEISPNYNAAPGQTMPVITEEGLRLMRWGVLPRWAKDVRVGHKMINARSETVFDKATWKSLITRHRCLVLANGYYEWQQREHGKQPFFIRPRLEKLFAFAGLWSAWEHAGRVLLTYSIITTRANTDTEGVHDRMPVILHRSDEARWLAADTREDIEPLLVPYEDHGILLHEVGTDVNSIKNNNETLIRPLFGK